MTTPRKITPTDQPVFPCWLYCTYEKPFVKEVFGWVRKFNSRFALTEAFTHWHPDQPHAPTATPDTSANLNTRKCLRCDGDGHKDSEELCPACGGRGYVPDTSPENTKEGDESADDKVDRDWFKDWIASATKTPSPEYVWMAARRSLRKNVLAPHMAELARLRIYEALYKEAVDSCLWMHNDPTLKVTLGKRLTSEGVLALKAQRDELRSTVARLEAELKTAKDDKELMDFLEKEALDFEFNFLLRGHRTKNFGMCCVVRAVIRSAMNAARTPPNPNATQPNE